MSKLLTVSVAAYKVEKYIRETLESCVIPEIMDELEVLIIVDGVCDSTPDIAREYEEKYPDTFRVLIKENGGYGTTVNRGIDEASGKFFKLLDGDDGFNKDSFLGLFNFLKTADTDWVVTPCENVMEDTGKTLLVDPLPEGVTSLVDGKTIDAAELDFDFFTGHWMNTFRTEILKKNMPELPGGCNLTDELYNTYTLPFVKRISFLSEPVYRYLIRNREFTPAEKNKMLKNFIFIRRKQLKFFGNTGKTENYRAFKNRVGGYYRKLIKNILSMPPSPRMYNILLENEAYCRKYAKDIFNDEALCGRVLKLLRKTGYSYPVYLILARYSRDFMVNELKF